ncbi:AAA family ATPase [Vogesella indigofera]|uniref:AAA family ATPase n=1 Tax=Vogesella indigofera TaxID=45465 RepID=UPI000EB1DE15|nr:AAA family ATPase [Vogesella indigofera]
MDAFPEVSLSEQGNGIQSTVLYQTHYLLDSDRTIHRGRLHFPIWLIEEPETFLHADIAYKLGKLLVSDEWLGAIQMVITTHSPLILAASSSSGDNISWSLLNQGQLEFSKEVSELDASDFDRVGACLGEPNFEVYFNASKFEDSLIIEDSRALTADVLVKSGVPVTKRLTGSSELKKYVDTLRVLDLDVSSRVIFLLDNDKGAREFKSILREECVEARLNGFVLYKIKDYLFVILFPEDMAVEDMFSEYDDSLCSDVDILYDFNEHANDGGATVTRAVPPDLSRAHAEIRGKSKVGSVSEAKRQIAKCQDVKDRFWVRVEKEELMIDNLCSESIRNLLVVSGWRGLN